MDPSRSLKISPFDTAHNYIYIYDFQLTFHSNHGPSRTISETDGDFRRRLQNYPTPLYFAPLLKGFPLELGIGTWVKKLE